MNPACTGGPISWLRIERYALAELPADEVDAIERHLDECEACRSCVALTKTPRVLPPLPELPASSPTSSRPRRVNPRALGLLGTTLAAAAALILMLRPATGRDESSPPESLRIRGGDVQITLVRERGGEIVENPSGFEREDRWKVLLTCPPDPAASYALWIEQDGQTSRLPLDTDAIRCGNRVAIPGAFRITGSSDANVCVTWSSDTAPLGGLEPESGESVCHRLEAPIRER